MKLRLGSQRHTEEQNDSLFLFFPMTIVRPMANEAQLCSRSDISFAVPDCGCCSHAVDEAFFMRLRNTFFSCVLDL